MQLPRKQCVTVVLDLTILAKCAGTLLPVSHVFDNGQLIAHPPLMPPAP